MYVTGNLCCVVKTKHTDDANVEDAPSEWVTLTWKDEFGNSIAPFFTSIESGLHFLKGKVGWQLKCYPVSFVVEVILADIEQATSFYTIDPISSVKFTTLSPVQFLTALICRKHPTNTDAEDVGQIYRDIVPIETLLGEGRDPVEEFESRRLLAVADLIFGVDILNGKQSIIYGRSSLEDLVRTGESHLLGIVNVGLDQETMEMEKLATLVHSIKGRSDYHAAAGAR